MAMIVICIYITSKNTILTNFCNPDIPELGCMPPILRFEIGDNGQDLEFPYCSLH